MYGCMNAELRWKGSEKQYDKNKHRYICMLVQSYIKKVWCEKMSKKLLAQQMHTRSQAVTGIEEAVNAQKQRIVATTKIQQPLSCQVKKWNQKHVLAVVVVVTQQTLDSQEITTIKCIKNPQVSTSNAGQNFSRQRPLRSGCACLAVRYLNSSCSN